MAVEIVCGSDDGRIGSVLSLPGVEAHHGDRWRAFSVVGFGEQTPAPRGNAEGFKEIAGDVLAVGCRDRGWRTGAPHAQVGVSLSDLKGGQLLERGGVGAE